MKSARRGRSRAPRTSSSPPRAIGALEVAELAARLEAAGNNADWPAAETSHQALEDAWARLEQRFEKGSR
jgi:hypothetical protein